MTLLMRIQFRLEIHWNKAHILFKVLILNAAVKEQQSLTRTITMQIEFFVTLAIANQSQVF